MKEKDKRNQRPFFILDDETIGYRIVYCPAGPPRGKKEVGANYMTIADRMSLYDAEGMLRRLQGREA